MLRKPVAPARDGVVLLVVISLLVLFSLVGLAFVVYAEGQANISRLWREAETLQQPRMDPELLLSYFLGQLIYDTDNPNSALRGHSLARTMYGRPGGSVPFNGTGRLHTGGGADDYYNVDYTAYPWNAGRSPDQYGSPNPSYTYPDFNNVYLAAVKARDGSVLIPSYVRIGPNGNVVSLRPDTRYHTNFPPQADPSGDVRNLGEGPGYKGGPNDSIWIDAGFPVMIAPDGRKFKPLFAPHIQDLDGRINLNVHGNTLGNIGGNYWGVSHQGWCPGEVNIDRILTGPNREAGNIFMGDAATGLPGRYDKTRWASFWGGGGWGGRSNEELKNIYAPGGHFYTSTNLDCWPYNDPNALRLPTAASNFGFPILTGAYSHGWMQRNDNVFNPSLYNIFDPRQNSYWLGAPPAEQLNNRSFPPGNLEAVLRYGDAGSPSMGSDLFRLCPVSLSDAKTRRLVTTHAFDVERPGLMPTLANGDYRLAAGSPFPSRPPVAAPAAGPSPQRGEFGASWAGMSSLEQNLALLSRIDLNRGFTDYPMVDAQHRINAAGYTTAHAERAQLAQEIFNVLRTVTGASDPATSAPGTPEYDALRWLAQLAVNIVDFVNFPRAGSAGATTAAPDDIMTCFNWNPNQRTDVKNGWVFGTVLPRLVVNEAYVEVSNTAADVQTPPTRASRYDVNVWAELHNPFASDVGGGRVNGYSAVPIPEAGVARLFNTGTPGYAPYRLLVARTVSETDPTKDNTQELTKPDNVTGEPINVETVVDQYTPETVAPATLVLTGDDLNQVKPNYANAKVNPSPPGSNQGFFVLGPKKPFPGTDTAPQFFATLPVKEQASQTASQPGAQSSMRYTYTPANAQQRDFSNLKHTLVLQRLACPYLPWQNNPSQPNFNPYVTVDHVSQVPINDAVTVDGAGQHNPTPVAQRQSSGRNQPYAADVSQQVKQQPAAAPAAGQPLHTLFDVNSQGANAQGQQFPRFAYDWLVHMNRPLVSTIELLDVSGYHPHELTQRFMTQGTDPQTGRPVGPGKFQQRAPWLQPGNLTFRALEFLQGGLRPQWTPIGGRFAGRVNINTIWDDETFKAICDRWPIHFFTDAAVQNIYNNFTASRTPNGTPRAGDRPFLGLAAPFAAPGDVQYPPGAGIEDTILRPDPNPPPTHPLKRLLEPQPDPARGEFRTEGADQPYLRMEFLNRIFGNLTTRSNVFAIWVTVGYFEVEDDASSGPPRLGKEIGRAENRHKRHRMFAIVDRSNLTLDTNRPGEPGQRPFFINALTAVQAAGQATVSVPALQGRYEESTWSIQANTQLVVGSGPDAEVVTVTAVDGLQMTFTANFARAHPVGFAVGNAAPGNPGPQPRFELRNPIFSGLVRYASIVE